jgi:hypothetical protein
MEREGGRLLTSFTNNNVPFIPVRSVSLSLWEFYCIELSREIKNPLTELVARLSVCGVCWMMCSAVDW